MPRKARIFTEAEVAQYNAPPRTMPKVDNPLVQLVFRRMILDRISFREMEERTGYSPDGGNGVSYWTLRDWRTGTEPRNDKLTAALLAVGYEIVARPIGKPAVALPREDASA